MKKNLLTTVQGFQSTSEIFAAIAVSLITVLLLGFPVLPVAFFTFPPHHGKGKFRTLKILQVKVCLQVYFYQLKCLCFIGGIFIT